MLSGAEKNFIMSIRKKVGKAINRYGLLGAGERVLLAMSGGKDSLVLADTIRERLKYLPIRYELCAAHVQIEGHPCRPDLGYLASFCDERGIPLHVRRISPGIDFSDRKSICFYCSWHRRKTLFMLVKELGCSRLALGHHMDDIVETLLMNMAIHGNFSTMPVKLSMFEGEFDIIRPLGLVTEKELARYVKLKGFRLDESTCPFGEQTRRAEVKQLLREMGKLSRNAKKNIFASMHNIHPDYLS